MVAKQLSILGELRSSAAKGQQVPPVGASQAFLCCGKKPTGSNNHIFPFLCGFKTLIYFDSLRESNLFLSTPSATTRDVRCGIALHFQLERSTVPGTGSPGDVLTDSEIAPLGAAAEAKIRANPRLFSAKRAWVPSC